MDYPVNLRLDGRRCVVVGGGRVAARRASSLLEAGAEIRVVAPEAREEIRKAASEGRLQWERRAFEPADLDGAFLVFAATDSPPVNRRVAEEARIRGALVDVADGSVAGDFTLPSVARGRRWQVAVSTAGASPALARWFRMHVEREFGGALDVLLDWLSEIRGRPEETGRSQEERAAAYERVLSAGILDRLRTGDRAGARKLFEETIAREGNR